MELSLGNSICGRLVLITEHADDDFLGSGVVISEMSGNLLKHGARGGN